MLNEDQLEDFYLVSRLKGRGWLLPFAKLARETGYELTVEDDHIDDPMIRVTNLETHQWLELPFEGTEEEDIERLIREFPDRYTSMFPSEPPLEDQGQYDPEGAWEVESIPIRIVDVMLEGVNIDPEDFASGFSKEQSRVGGRPFNSQPTGKKVIRAVQLRSGHKLYIWRTNKRREHWGRGTNSFFGGYRFVAPDGTILFDGEGFHPGGKGDLTSNASIADLVQGLCISPDDHEEEFFKSYTPEQLEWAVSADAREIENEIGGDPGMLDSFPWTDLPGYERTPEEA